MKTKDTRSRNTYFSTKDISTYVSQYTGALANGLNKVDKNELEKALWWIRRCLAADGHIYVGGNGGSAAISDHLCCDFMKGTYSENFNNLRTISLTNSVSNLTAIANDISYDQSLSFTLELLRPTDKDLLILISSSGNSPNIIKAMEFASKRGMDVIGLTGFDGGKLKQFAGCSLHVPANNYGIVEDCHQAIMHILAQYHWLCFQ